MPNVATLILAVPVVATSKGKEGSSCGYPAWFARELTGVNADVMQVLSDLFRLGHDPDDTAILQNASQGSTAGDSSSGADPPRLRNTLRSGRTHAGYERVDDDTIGRDHRDAQRRDRR
jgi:hypothetical protein